MSTWTDERLGELITAALTAHEQDADPAAAHRIALAVPPAPRRGWLAVTAAAAVAVLLVAVGAYALRSDDATEPARPPDPSPSVVGSNRAAAEAEAELLLTNVPLPPRTRPVEELPSPQLHHVPASIGSVDPTLTRTEFRTVAMSVREVVRWYRRDNSAVATDGGLVWWTSAGSDAYTSPAVMVSYARLASSSTALRIDVTLAARDDRTPATYAPDDVTGIEITRSSPFVAGPPDRSVTVADPDRIRAIVAAYNDLLGDPADRGQPCGSPTGDTRWYDVTFHWPGHEMQVDTGSPLCGVGRTITLDGTELAPKVEDSDAFRAVLRAAF